jgi:hypothetical protein
MTPADSPLLFINNSSLVEFLATNCGLSLTKPNYSEKFNLIINSFKNKIIDIPNSVKSTVDQFMSSIINSGGLGR